MYSWLPVQYKQLLCKIIPLKVFHNELFQITLLLLVRALCIIQLDTDKTDAFNNNKIGTYSTNLYFNWSVWFSFVNIHDLSIGSYVITYQISVGKFYNKQYWWPKVHFIRNLCTLILSGVFSKSWKITISNFIICI